MKRLGGKVALLTGGNCVIGLATAKRLREEVAEVAIAGRDAQTLEEAAESMAGLVVVQADLTKLYDIDRLLVSQRPPWADGSCSSSATPGAC